MELHFHLFTCKKRCEVPSPMHKFNGYVESLVPTEKKGKDNGLFQLEMLPGHSELT